MTRSAAWAGLYYVGFEFLDQSLLSLRVVREERGEP